MTTENQISPSDLALLKKAQMAMVQATAKAELVRQHIADTYGLGQNDQVDTNTGEIIRRPSEGK